MFGQIHKTEDLRDLDNINVPMLFKIFCIFLATYCIQGWKTCKWFEIRDKTQDLQTLTSAIRFYKYIQV